MVSLEKLGLNHFRELLRKVHAEYPVKVASKLFAYGIFVRTFIASNRAFEAASVQDRMDYDGSLCLIEILLIERKDLAEVHFQTANPTVEEEDIILLSLLQERRHPQMEIRQRQEDKAPPKHDRTSLAFRGLTDGELQLIADCAKSVGIFTRDVSCKDVKKVLNETLTEPLTIKNLLLFTYLFDKLYELNLIHHHWQKALAVSSMPLLQENGQHISASNLSTALSRCKQKAVDGRAKSTVT